MVGCGWKGLGMTDWIKKIEESDAGKNDVEKVQMLVNVAVEEVKEELKLPPLSWGKKEDG